MSNEEEVTLTNEERAKLRSLLRENGFDQNTPVQVAKELPKSFTVLKVFNSCWVVSTRLATLAGVLLLPKTLVDQFVLWRPNLMVAYNELDECLTRIEAEQTDPEQFPDTRDFVVAIKPPSPPTTTTTTSTTTTTTPEPIPSGSGTVNVVLSLVGVGSNRSMEGATVIAASGLPPSIMPGMGMIRAEDYYG